MSHKLLVEWSWITGLSKQDILAFISLHFSEELIDTLETSKIIANNVVVHISDYKDPDAQLTEYSTEDFKQKLDSLPPSQQAELLTGVIAWINYWDEIVVFNQDFVFELYSVLMWKSLEEAEVEYLAWLSTPEIIKAYKIWVISHELWHSIYDLKINATPLQHEWKEITDTFWPVSKYVQQYVVWDDIYYEENFTESLRIYTTNPQYLYKKYPRIYMFILSNFPDISV